MVWAKAALVGGLLMLLAAFAFGTENQLSTSLASQTQDCGPSISASWLLSGTPDPAIRPGSEATDGERRAAAACGPVIRESRLVIVTTMSTGGLVALIGWTAIPMRREAAPSDVTPVNA